MSNKREILIGNQHQGLAKIFQHAPNLPQNGSYYYEGDKGLEMVAISSIKYRDNVLGYVLVSHKLNKEWLQQNKQVTGGEFFLIENNRVLISTLPGEPTISLQLDTNNLLADNKPYRVYQIDLPGIRADKPELWFGLSESEVIEKLDKHRSFMLGLLGVGTIGVIMMGLLIIRNFNGPLKQIGNITRQVVAGELPNLERNRATNEFDELRNNFSDMLKSLREQQKVIEETHRNLEQSAITDSLTGLYNRRYLQDVYPKLFASVDRDDQCIYAIIMDLDYFKKINDTYGHIAGDQCLTSFSQIMQQSIRSSDHLFRLGGEEFLILSVHKNIHEAATFADKIRRKVETSPVVYTDQMIRLTVSGGVSRMKRATSAENSLKVLLTQADTALYQAKEIGRNRICIYSDTDPAIRYQGNTQQSS